MTSFGYLFALVGVLLLRQVAVGRVKELPTDTRDFFVAVLNGDMGTAQSVMAQRGTNVAAGENTGEVATAEGSPAATHSDLANKVVALGSKASGYRIGASGPQYYDCSGLIWKAVKALGIYDGPRFTTSTFHFQSKGWVTKVDTPAAGDIVLWPKHHMGISLGGDSIYSARSTAKGIGRSTISGDNGYFHSEAEYWRVSK